jgi:hypothetical protein
LINEERQNIQESERLCWCTLGILPATKEGTSWGKSLGLYHHHTCLLVYISSCCQYFGLLYRPCLKCHGYYW